MLIGAAGRKRHYHQRPCRLGRGYFQFDTGMVYQGAPFELGPTVVGRNQAGQGPLGNCRAGR